MPYCFKNLLRQKVSIAEIIPKELEINFLIIVIIKGNEIAIFFFPSINNFCLYLQLANFMG